MANLQNIKPCERSEDAKRIVDAFKTRDQEILIDYLAIERRVLEDLTRRTKR